LDIKISIIMSFDEFKKTIYYTEKYIIIPPLRRIRIEKTKFMIKGKFNQKKLDKYLEELYNNKFK